MAWTVSALDIVRPLMTSSLITRRHPRKSSCCGAPLDASRYFDHSGNMKKAVPAGAILPDEQIARFADMFTALGTEPRLRIMRLLLSAYPEGMVVSDIAVELEIPASTLSHHLDKLKNEDLVSVRREGTYLRYSANTGALQELLGFLYAECCTRNRAVEPQAIVTLCR
jgi:DNA-binding transcriptional ArsR family regulator